MSAPTIRRSRPRFGLRLAGALIALAVLGAACGDDDKSGSGTEATERSKPEVTIGSFNFPESVTLAEIYAAALKRAGFRVTVKANLGSREIVEPAFQKGEIDVVPEYLGNVLSYLAPDAGKPGDNVATSTTKLREAFKPKHITVLDASAAEDGDALGVTKATADKFHLATISDLVPVAGQLVLGGPPECATRITCKAGLEQVYGMKFKDFKALDGGGPITKAALDKGDVQVARLFSSDSAITTKNYVILADDKHVQPAGNIIPVVRDAKAVPELVAVLNSVSKTMTTSQLVEINRQLDVDKLDPAAVAEQWLAKYGSGA